jgi:hypothetical protein
MSSLQPLFKLSLTLASPPREKIEWYL